ncbi:hypothetical protein QFZ24_000404 [Streptomyces phaeochromogenes]|jgi:hypothetical protein|uniref:DUF2855 family protein n=1 Tax=Streptomyces phaeochromogenes TaxID=1923 RepID=UPI0027919BB5|nr:DUF2855 family protein [Streptomyces phaeochromogenes]MDQ0946481.1 hypothetical protein [Streptomyces phaeochromogenes]
MLPTSGSRALEFRRDDPLRTTRVVHDLLSASTSGNVLLRIERLVLTFNNVTYALNGHKLGYWAPFPASEPAWGRVPAWGVARVIDGDTNLARRGQLLAGFMPMATHVLVQAEPFPDGMRATAPERAEMHPLYRDLHYVDDRINDVEVGVWSAVPSAAHLDDELRESSPTQVVFSSATSRTALTTSVLLRRAGIHVVGLTASVRTATAKRAGAYDEILSYDDLAAIARAPGTVYADVAGRPDITAAVHRHLGPALARSLRIGATHAATARDVELKPAPVPTPSVEQFNVGLRRVELAERMGQRHVDELERRARGVLFAWATGHLASERTVGLDQARALWERTWRGELDSMAVAVIIPN